MIKTVPTDTAVSCTVRRTIQPQCPIRDEPDRYDVMVSWKTSDKTLEKHSLAGYLDSFNKREMTQEAIAQEIASAVRSAGVVGVSVRVQDTAHIDMEVTA